MFNNGSLRLAIGARAGACRLAVMMPLCMKVIFLACSMSKDGLEDAIFGMEQWRECGDTARKFQPLPSRKS